jgi:hypothetical protein
VRIGQLAVLARRVPPRRHTRSVSVDGGGEPSLIGQKKML